MTAKNEKTNGHEPIMLRIRSAARSPRVSWEPERTPGCRCQRLCHGDLVTIEMVARCEALGLDARRKTALPLPLPTLTPVAGRRFVAPPSPTSLRCSAPCLRPVCPLARYRVPPRLPRKTALRRRASVFNIFSHLQVIEPGSVVYYVR